MEKFDVAIVGAGLAGLQCARLLARQGLRVLLADRKTALDKKIHTTGIFVRRTLEDFDLPEDCLGPVIRNVSLFSPAHRVLDLASKQDEFRVGRMGQLYLRYLTQCLLSDVTWLPGATYLDSFPTTNGSTVRLNVSGSSTSIQTRFLIGADGACSNAARDLKLDVNRDWIVGVEDVFEDVALTGPPRLFCFLNPRLAPGYIAWIANDGEQTHVGVGGYAAKFDPVSALDQFQTEVRHLMDVRAANRIERRGGRIPVGGVLKNIVNERGLLIGDAAGAVSPLTAGGLDPCMRLSTLAASVTNSYLATGDRSVFQRYSGELFRTKFTSRMWARRVAAQVDSQFLAEVGCAALRLPLINQLAAKVFFGRGSFPDVRLELPGQLSCSDDVLARAE